MDSGPITVRFRNAAASTRQDRVTVISRTQNRSDQTTRFATISIAPAGCRT